jgi:3-hydroxyacyl-[acyl-carrier-protein] dehydratase
MRSFFRDTSRITDYAGRLQIEAMAQTAGALVVEARGNYEENKVGVFFMSIDGVKFRKPVKPGDQLKMHVEKIKARRNIFVFRGETKVDGQVVSELSLRQ